MLKWAQVTKTVTEKRNVKIDYPQFHKKKNACEHQMLRDYDKLVTFLHRNQLNNRIWQLQVMYVTYFSKQRFLKRDKDFERFKDFIKPNTEAHKFALSLIPVLRSAQLEHNGRGFQTLIKPCLPNP